MKTEIKTGYCGDISRPVLRTVLPSVSIRCLFLFAVCLFVQHFIYSPDVSAQTNRRQTVRRERESLLIAQTAPQTDKRQLLQNISNEFSSGSKKIKETVTIFFFLILLLLFICGLIYYDAVYIKGKENLENPWVVFRELCKAHQLKRSEKAFLQRAADELDLDDPLPLFIEPKFLKSLLENQNFKADRFEVLKLLHKFFGIEPPDRTPSMISVVKKSQILT